VDPIIHWRQFAFANVYGFFMIVIFAPYIFALFVAKPTITTFTMFILKRTASLLMIRDLQEQKRKTMRQVKNVNGNTRTSVSML
jgi:hypothetical protein